VTIRTPFRQPLTAILLAAALLIAAVALGACGGGGGGDGGNDADAQELLDKAFATPIPSADVDVDLQFDVKGLAGFDDPLRVRASGPYVRSEKALPKLDLDVAVEAQGAGQAIQIGALSTGDRVFVEFAGTHYEQPADQVAATNRRLARNDGKGGGALADFGIDANKWVVDARIEGEEEIGGVTTEHVTGTLDVEAALTDLNKLVKESAGSLGEAGDVARPLGRKEIERLADSVEDPTFDVYVGKDDDIVRRVAMTVDVDVPEQDRKDVGGMTGAAIRFSAQLDDVGGEQKISAPRSSQPLSALTSQIGSLDALAGGLGGLRGDTTTPAPAPDGSGDTTTGLDDFERYAECLDAANPDDSTAIAECRALLP
jgi:hypothetical protein